MNLEQATVALKYGLPVIINNNNLAKNGENYTITSLTKNMHRYENTFSYSAGVTTNGKCIYNLPIYDLQPHPEFESAYNLWIDQSRTDNLKYYINLLINEGGNKTTITKKVKELIDQIRNEAKTK